ncbi:hypothetical protein [Streptomyces sp. MMS24-I29]|uniref:hypothetical protein n=1 Tax=Streptomyces sp. MMS24-I29 TaxID=3351480 RepID=UPI003C7EBE7D
MRRGRRLWSLGLALVCTTAAWLVPAGTSQAATTPVISIESPGDGATVQGRTMTVHGRYAETSDLKLVVDAQQTVPVTTDADNGTWSATVDISDKDGTLGLAAYGKNNQTLYTQWSSFLSVDVHNPAAAKPGVRIVSPRMSDKLHGTTLRSVIEVDSRKGVRSVQVRANGGSWQSASRVPGSPNRYAALLDVRSLTPGFAGLEARATDLSGRVGTSTSTYVSLGGATPAPRQTYDQDRAMWVWEQNSYPAVFDTAARDRLGRMMDDTTTFPGSDPVRTLYLGVDDYQGKDMLREARPQVASFIRWARGRGYHVQAVVAAGTVPPYLGVLPQYQDHAVREFQKVLDYNLSAPADARFDGVNVDIEPYILPQWKEPGSGNIPVVWLDLLEKLVHLRDASGQPLLFGPAIPSWFDSSTVCCTAVTWHGKTAPLSDHVQDLSDYVSLMDYVDHADGPGGIIARAAHEVAYARQIGKPESVVIGVETKDLTGGGDPQTVTFWEEGRTYMEAELAKVYAAYAPDEQYFAGIAMHHYQSLLVLPSVQGGGGVTYPQE